MNELISKIDEHKLDNDPKICYELLDLIINCEINSLEELKKLEEQKFTINGILLLEEDIVESLYNAYISDFTHIEKLEKEDNSRLIVLENEYKKAENIEDKIIILIKMYSIMNWSMELPYRAYCLIMENKLK